MFYMYMLLFLVWNIWMASFLTIPLYKLVCNLSYIDNLQNITFYSKEWCIMNGVDVFSFLTYFLSSHNYSDICIQVWNSSGSCDVVVLYNWNAHEYSDVNIFLALDFSLPCNDSLCNYFNVTFVSRVSNFTLLEFVSLQDSVIARSGEPVLVFFRIYNPTGVGLTGMSMYFVYPSNMALFVTKVQCFCFDLLQIKQYESVELPVLFYIETALDLETIVFDSTIYISYVFFLQ